MEAIINQIETEMNKIQIKYYGTNLTNFLDSFNEATLFSQKYLPRINILLTSEPNKLDKDKLMLLKEKLEAVIRIVNACKILSSDIKLTPDLSSEKKNSSNPTE